VAVDAEFLVDKATSAEAETRRYPKRNIERKNYHESSDEETDPGNFCFCEYNVLSPLITVPVLVNIVTLIRCWKLTSADTSKLFALLETYC